MIYLLITLIGLSIFYLQFIFTLDRAYLSFIQSLLIPLSNPVYLILLIVGETLLGILTPFIDSHLKESEDNRFNVSEDKTYGDTTLAGLKDFESNDLFTVTKNLRENKDLILGEYQERTIAVKVKRGNNENGVLIGSSGSGKTSSFILPNLVNSIRRGESILVIDPKGELFQKTIRRLKRNGYKVGVLNFKNTKLSDRFNLLANVTLKRESVMEMAEMLFYNLGLNNSGSEFFESSAMLILAFILTTSIQYKEYYEAGILKAPVISVNGFRVGTIGYAFDLLYSADDDKTVIENLKAIYEKNKKYYTDNEAQAFYKLFNPGDKSSLIENYLANLKSVFRSFFDPDTMAIFSEDDLKIDDALKEKTAYFLIMNESSSSSRNKLASVFINLLMVRYEYLKDNYREEYPQVFRFILDEFGAIGRINGFESILSGCRSRDMSVLFVLQDINQLKNNYPGIYNSILGNCNLVLSTGVRDEPSRSFISELMGSTTIDKRTVIQGKDGKLSESSVPTERKLFRSDELLSLDFKNVGIIGNIRFLLNQLRYHQEYQDESGLLVEEYMKQKLNGGTQG